ncbi:hypothetical protein BC827DRAFT_127530 [Russula dissimulans]|nr:hypothetical protein BC827DRAFT_127530 [Russula dissimulans]
MFHAFPHRTTAIVYPTLALGCLTLCALDDGSDKRKISLVDLTRREEISVKVRWQRATNSRLNVATRLGYSSLTSATGESNAITKLNDLGEALKLKPGSNGVRSEERVSPRLGTVTKDISCEHESNSDPTPRGLRDPADFQGHIDCPMTHLKNSERRGMKNADSRWINRVCGCIYALCFGSCHGIVVEPDTVVPASRVHVKCRRQNAFSLSQGCAPSVVRVRPYNRTVIDGYGSTVHRPSTLVGRPLTETDALKDGRASHTITSIGHLHPHVHPFPPSPHPLGSRPRLECPRAAMAATT